MRNDSTKLVYELVRQDKNVLALTADNRNEVYNRIRKEYPDQYIEYGIAEENMVASAAGLASCGFIPFLYTITNFMSMRAFEFIRNDVCIGKQNVKFLGRSAGLASSSMGPTHQGTDELNLLRGLPNLKVITPASPIEAREATRFAYGYTGPVYIRLEATNEPELYEDTYRFGEGKSYVLREGRDITVISMGSVVNEALKAANELRNRYGIEARIIDMPMVKPIDRETILISIEETGGIVTLEEHSIYGGLGSAVAEVVAQSGRNTRFCMMGLNGCSTGCGNRKQMRELNGLDAKNVVTTVKRLLNRL